MYNSERFIMNSDALSFAQSSSSSAIVTRPEVRTGNGNNQNYEGTIEVNIPSVDGAIPIYTIEYEATVLDDQFQPKKQSISFPCLGAFTISDVYDAPLVYQTYFSLRRISGEKLAVDYFIARHKPNTTYPAMTFTLNVKYLYPPNVL